MLKSLSVGRLLGGTLYPRGQSPDRWGLTNKAMNLKFYDFSSNSIWNKGPTKKALSVKYILRNGPFVRDGETHRLSVMCQLGLGFCNLKKLFESNVLFSFTG